MRPHVASHRLRHFVQRLGVDARLRALVHAGLEHVRATRDARHAQGACGAVAARDSRDAAKDRERTAELACYLLALELAHRHEFVVTGASPVVIGRGHALVERVEVIADLVGERAVAQAQAVEPRERRIVSRRQPLHDEEPFRIGAQVIAELFRREALCEPQLTDRAQLREFRGLFLRKLLQQVVRDPVIDPLEGVEACDGRIGIVGVAVDLVGVVAHVPLPALRVADGDFKFQLDAGGFDDAPVDPQVHLGLALRHHAHVVEAEGAAAGERLGQHLWHVVGFGAPYARCRDALVGVEIDDAVLEHADTHVELRGAHRGRDHGRRCRGAAAGRARARLHVA